MEVRVEVGENLDKKGEEGAPDLGWEHQLWKRLLLHRKAGRIKGQSIEDL